MRPFNTLDAASARGIRAVLFDIDDTITESGYLLEESYSALWRLRASGLAVVPVTGRPAGWCDLIARQWPVDGVIGENGAFAFFRKDDRLERLYHPAAPDPGANRERLDDLGVAALRTFPGLRIAKDQRYRLFDLALDFAEESPDLGLALASRVREFCEGAGAVAKVSSIHVNAWFGVYDKLSMAELFLAKALGFDPSLLDQELLYFGDSPNDEPMFRRFPLSCGVANVSAYAALLRSPPAYVTEESYGRGFAEGVTALLALRSGN